jgi:predicted component of type VI protein secretion system
MAYLIFTTNGEETDRRELLGSIVIGRAPDCDVSIHDIILSRHHCRIEPINEEGQQRWSLTDLHSKNGTHLRGVKIERRTLVEGDELRIGRTRLTFRAGAFVPGAKPRPRAVVRAADPSEALAGTISGMVVCEPGETQTHPHLPSPKPRPADPSAYMRDDVYGMINEIISSSWDSVMAQNSQPIRMQRAMPTPAATKAGRGGVQPKPRVSFALQASHREPTPDPKHRDDNPGAARILARWRTKRTYITATIGATILFIAAWIAMLLVTAPQNISEQKSPAPRIDAGSAVPASSTVAHVDFSVSYLAGY